MLNKKWKEVVYALTAFGPNFVMVAMMAYYTDAMDPRLLKEGMLGIQSIANYPLVAVMLFGILWSIGRIFDGIIDVPFASLTDRMPNKYARVRFPIIIGTVPMIAGFILTCIPLTMAANSVANTIWFFAMSIVFFAAYTLVLIAFYGSLATVCVDERQRARVSTYKSIVDTVVYSIVYALIPFLSGLMGINVVQFMMMSSPLMLTILIPLFLLKKSNKTPRPSKTRKAGFFTRAIISVKDFTLGTERNADGTVVVYKQDEEIKKVGLFKSLKFVFTNKAFIAWLVVNSVSFFGLQMFLASMNALISGVMGLNVSWHQLVLNTAAFAPVPLMLFIFYKVLRKKGPRFAFQTSLIAFAVSILAFLFASEYFWRDNVTLRIIVGCIGGTVGSYGIGSFFMMPLMIPAQVAAVDLKVTKRNNSAMYFAGQALVTSVIGAIATGVVYSAIKGIYFNESTGLITNYTQKMLEANPTVIDDARTALAGTGNLLVPVGGMLVPIIVAVSCLIAFGIAFLMPKRYDAKTIGKLFDKSYTHVDAEENSTVLKVAEEETVAEQN
ncbi:MAG: MFS transporter [Clostridiales bacterium]|jgi:Na+/melibiose symporter-like transporter|nr:MFS transporter [Clostridiales bacterium]